MSRKTMAEKIAELKRKESWRLRRKADKLAAQATALTLEAETLEEQAREALAQGGQS